MFIELTSFINFFFSDIVGLFFVHVCFYMRLIGKVSADAEMLESSVRVHCGKSSCWSIHTVTHRSFLFYDNCTTFKLSWSTVFMATIETIFSNLESYTALEQQGLQLSRQQSSICSIFLQNALIALIYSLSTDVSAENKNESFCPKLSSTGKHNFKLSKFTLRSRTERRPVALVLNI